MRRIAAAAALILASVAAGAQAPPADPPPAVPAFTDTGAVTLRGIVRDTAGRSLVGAHVITAEATAITEADGRFELRGLRADTINLLVRRIGHQPTSITLAPDRGVVVEFAATLVPNAVELGTIVIEGRTLDRRLWSEGFYDRAKLGHGTYLGPEELGRYASLGSALRMAPNVRVTRGPDGRVAAYGPSGVGHCLLSTYVDGVFVRWAHDVGLETLIPQGEVLAMEIYARASQVPAMLRVSGGSPGVGTAIPSPGGAVLGGEVDCGALAVWTKPYGAVR